MKYLLIGTGLSLTGILLAIIIWDVHMISNVTSGIGFIFLIVACLFSGAFVNGDRMRANWANETKESWIQRNKIAWCSLIMAIPNFAIAFIFYYYLGY
ncbi:DUF5316 domain-containing protein [Solibacillus sp. FSL W7-1464]|uniref:DUF5316 domain-containing protein n=1 Tax=Solibacillus sp. FSL W7-1464 TaxID=2921706 RepID=UPI0030F7A7AD